MLIKMEMNVGKLKEIIKNLPDDMPVFVACEAHCNYDFRRGLPCEDTDTFAIVRDGKLFITDEFAVNTGTSWCLIFHIDADTKECDEALMTIYSRAAIDEVIDYELYELFMIEFVV